MSSRCLISDDMIAIQRQMLAERVLQAKGLIPPARGDMVMHKREPFQLVPLNQRQQQKSNYSLPFVQPVTQSTDSRQQLLVDKQPPLSPFKKGYRNDDACHSISTATMTTMSSEKVLPLHLPTFKPAVGCIDATDFMIRCFVARLRSGVTVYKHHRSRFKKSPRPYILKLASDGESLSWLPVDIDSDDTSFDAIQSPQKTSSSPRSSKRLKLSECVEVRLACTPDPENPNFTGSANLRAKCEVADAHKSFALIFEHRTLDITSTTEDQAKMLTEGFSALCYRLHMQKNAKQRHDRYQDETKGRSCIRLY